MAFEDLLRLQAYLRGDGRNPMAEALQQRGARQRQLEDRAQQRTDVFESQRRAQEFQREEGVEERKARERLVDKQANAYLNRLKAMQDSKLDALYPKREGETDEQRRERAGKEQAKSINEFLEDVAASEKEIEDTVGAESSKKEARLKTLASRSPFFLDKLDKKTAAAIQSGTLDVDGALAAMGKKNPSKAAEARAALDSEIESNRDKLPDLTPQAQVKLRNLQKDAEAANERASLLLRTYERDGSFLGAPWLRSTRRASGGGAAVPPPSSATEAAKALLGGKPPSLGGSASTGATPATGPGAGSSSPLRLPGAGVVPNLLNQVIEPAAKYLPLGAEIAGKTAVEPFRGLGGWFGNAGRYLFTGNPLQPNEPPPEVSDFISGLGSGYNRLRNEEVYQGRPAVIAMPPPPMPDAALGPALREPVRSAPLAANVTVNDLQEFMANELGMDPAQIQQHFDEKASGNPEAAEAEQELLSQIMRRRAMPPPSLGEPALMR